MQQAALEVILIRRQVHYVNFQKKYKSSTDISGQTSAQALQKAHERNSVKHTKLFTKTTF